MAEAGDLEGGDEGDDRSEGDVGEAGRHPAQDEECDDFEGERDDGGSVAPRVQMSSGDNADEEAQDGYEMWDDCAPPMAQEGDAEESDVSCHGVGEDVAVVEVDERVEEAAGAGEYQCVRQRAWLGDGVGSHEDRGQVYRPLARVFDLHCLGSASCLASAGDLCLDYLPQPMESFWGVPYALLMRWVTQKRHLEPSAKM